MSDDTKYKLTYYNYRLRPEPTRIMFSMRGVPFEDVRITYEELPAVKETTPFGKIPVLEVDGEQIPQTQAIARYVARKLGFAGKSPLEEAHVDGFVDQINDFLQPWFDMYEVKIGKEEQKENAIEKTPALLGPIEKRLTDNDFLVGTEVTWPDIHLMNWVEFLQFDWEESRGAVDKFPRVLAHYERVRELPGIQEWIRDRPKTEY